MKIDINQHNISFRNKYDIYIDGHPECINKEFNLLHASYKITRHDNNKFASKTMYRFIDNYTSKNNKGIINF
jgi:hypothetical protein